ncbi:hypothetical protein [Nocardia macrotermitis]|nr:hypothetical protein [Nocardia macrotermitis]
MNVDVGALKSFVGDLRDEAGAITKLQSGIGDASDALPGTGWSDICNQTKTSVDNALARIGKRLTTVADSVEKVNNALQMTDQQFADDLKKIEAQV